MSAPEPRNPGKGILTKKLGPLPTWGWMIAGLGVAVIIASINKNKTASKADKNGATDQSGSAGGADSAYGPDLIGGNQRAPVVFQSYTTTLNNIPPAAGRPFPPSAVGAPCPPTGQAGEWIVVSQTKHGKAQWRSSLEGIAKEILGDRSQWRTIWNAPENASLRSRRKNPDNLHGGDRVWVPECGPSGAACPPGFPGGAVPCPPAPGGIGLPPPPVAGQPVPPPFPGFPPPGPPPPGPMPQGPPPPPPGPPQHSQPPGRSGSRRYSRS